MDKETLIVAVFGSVVVLLRLLVIWGICSVAWSGIKTSVGQCGHSGMLDKVLVGDLFCPETEGERP